MKNNNPVAAYALRLGDNGLVLAQRLGEWCGHAPELEIDLALANIGLDLLGQARNFLSYAAELAGSGDEDTLAFGREVRYHQRFSRGWLERLGNGTALSAQRMQSAVDNLWRFTGELFQADELEIELSAQGIAVDPRELQGEWQSAVHTALIDSGLQIPQEAAFRSGGKQGLHSEHLGPLLAEMQYLQRAYPGQQW